MINVVIWLGKIKYSADLAIVFARNNIRIVDENFENTDDLLTDLMLSMQMLMYL